MGIYYLSISHIDPWDGHDTETKYKRIDAFIKGRDGVYEELTQTLQ